MILLAGTAVMRDERQKLGSQTNTDKLSGAMNRGGHHKLMFVSVSKYGKL